MRITAEFAHPAVAPAAVVAMLLDEDFQRRKCLAGGADPTTVAVRRDGRRMTVVRRMPTDTGGVLVRRAAPDGVEVREQLDLPAAGDAGVWRARLHARMVGQPLRMTGTLTVGPQGEGCRAVLAADLVATVPLLAGRVEALVGPLVRRAVDAELAVGRSWLDGLAEPGSGRCSVNPAERS